MYIPTVFFSEGGDSEFLVATGGLESTWVSGSYLWKSHAFTTAGTTSFVVSSGNTSEAKILLVASGGTRGQFLDPPDPSPFYYGGSGGAGGMLEYSNRLISSGSYQVLVGAAVSNPTTEGADGFNGNPSTFSGNGISLSVQGGGGGGGGNRNGKSGGSGGGAGGGKNPGSGIAGQGFSGGPWIDLGAALGGGPGGGAGGPGTSDASGNGGPGRQSTIYYGVNAYYAGGGRALNAIPVVPLPFDGIGFYGRGGGQFWDNSQSGIVIIAYPFKRISTLRTELARFTPTIPSGTLEYVEAVSGELKQYNFTTSASIDLCIVSGSQYNAYNTGSEYSNVSTSFPFVNSNVTKTTLSFNSCS